MPVKILSVLAAVLFSANLALVLLLRDKAGECERLLALYNSKASECAAFEERASGLAENARQCLEREKQSLAAARERESIMEQAVARERTEAEKENVVDDATRKRVADRLNRPL